VVFARAAAIMFELTTANAATVDVTALPVDRLGQSAALAAVGFDVVAVRGWKRLLDNLLHARAWATTADEAERLLLSADAALENFVDNLSIEFAGAARITYRGYDFLELSAADGSEVEPLVDSLTRQLAPFAAEKHISLGRWT
jgi:hypothetical protein